MRNTETRSCGGAFTGVLGLPAWASPRIVAPAPVPEMETPAGGESRHRPVMPPAVPRGQMLYENHCMSCHESVDHIREQQQAKSLPQLRARVLYWADYLHMRWGREEVDEVVDAFLDVVVLGVAD